MTSETYYLNLGWKVTATLLPEYWLSPGAKPGQQSDEKHLVRVAPDTIDSHAVVVAQSGSGKSFFLGRLIEEIVLRTRSTCLILDPNADFRRMWEVVPASAWTHARFDHTKMMGLPHEHCKAEFARKWANIHVCISTCASSRKRNEELIRIFWPELSSEMFSDDLTAALRNEFYHCHRFVEALSELHYIRFQNTGTPRNRRGKFVGPVDVLDDARRKLADFVGKIGGTDALRKNLHNSFDTPLARAHPDRETWPFYEPAVWTQRGIDTTIERAVSAADFVSSTCVQLYFGRAVQYAAMGIIEAGIPRYAHSRQRPRITVLDLPSIRDKRARLLAMSYAVSEQRELARQRWLKAMGKPPKEDTRSPMFIVVDEAHNAIPTTTTSRAEEALREEFRTIAAEGRKYGLFLILCTQRPDKIDPFVISECENKAIMKLGTEAVLNQTVELLGLQELPKPLLQKCLEFPKGRALLSGRWASGGPVLMYGAMRRTTEGGRSLQSDQWAVPYGTAK